MSEIKKLIEKLCPDGVEYKKLINEVDVLYGYPFDSRLFSEDSTYMPLIRIRDVMPAKASTYYSGEPIEEYRIKKGDILVGMDGNFNLEKWNDVDGLLNQRVCKLSSKNEDNILNGFIYHYLKPVFKSIEGELNSGTVIHLSAKRINKIEIPVPPIEVQRKIVDILDNYTELEAELELELETELEARRKQYEYYRDMLISSSNIRKIRDLTRVFSCPRVFKNQWQDSGVPFWRSSDVMSYHNGVKNPRGEVYISQSLYDELSQKSSKIEEGDILVTGGGSIGVPYLKKDNTPLFVKDADLICIKKCDSIVPSFLYHFFFSTSFRSYLKTITHDATIAHYTISQIMETPIPVPSIAEQERIASILDRFEALTTDLQSGLPAEIEARRKQYEYYREQLLTFKRL